MRLQILFLGVGGIDVGVSKILLLLESLSSLFAFEDKMRWLQIKTLHYYLVIYSAEFMEHNCFVFTIHQNRTRRKSRYRNRFL